MNKLLIGISLLSMETMRARNKVMEGITTLPSYKIAGELVSVIIPAYNEEGYLPALLSALPNQTYDNIETVVVDNYSEDNTATIASSMGVRVVTNTDFNLSKSRNIGAREARGNILVFIDADTIPEAQAIERVVDEINRGYEMVHVNRCCTDSHLQGMMRVIAGWSPFNAHSGAFIGVTRQAYDSVGGFDESCLAQDGCGEDVDFIQKVHSLYPSTYLRTVYAATSARRQKAEGYLVPTHFQSREIRGKCCLD